MYNTATTLINFQLKENGSIILEGQIPYGLLPVVERSLLHGTTRTLDFTVNLDTFTTSRAFSSSRIDGAEPSSSPLNSAQLVYDSIVNSIAVQTAAAQALASFELWNLQAQEEEINRQQQQLEEMSFQTQLLYQESLLAQNQLTEQRAQEMNQEAYRLDMLRAQTVTQIAVDPTTAVNALMSEVGHNGDVHRQIAACMKTNKEITKLVINSTATLWNASYELMDVIAFQSATDSEIASLVAEKVPSDSLLYQSLQRIGMIT